MVCEVSAIDRQLFEDLDTKQLVTHGLVNLTVCGRIARLTVVSQCESSSNGFELL